MFAKGNEITASSGQPVKLARPLDFLVVADHSDGMGFFPLLVAGDPTIMADSQGRKWYDMIHSGKGAEAAIDIITNFGMGTISKAILSVPGTPAYRSAWQETIKAAEEANEPGRFTAFIGYEWTSNTGGNKLHRNIIFRDNGAKAIQVEPFTTIKPFGSDNPVDLWKWMASYEEKTGVKVMDWEVSSSGYAAVWATENTREALFDTMERRETYATTGPRMIVRFFGGWDFEPKDIHNRLPAVSGYTKGLPMGGDLNAAPALTPGHGKAIVAAYLIGSRSTPWHALYLGLTVTMTHTLGVFALGLVALFASRYVMPDQLYPWLAAVSGLIVAVLGAAMTVSRLHPLLLHAEHLATGAPGQLYHQSGDHFHQQDAGHHHFHHHHHNDHHHHHGDNKIRHKIDHTHSHHHGQNHSHLPPGADGAPVTWKSLLGLGVSGGLLPCPSAVVLLLAAVSFNWGIMGIILVLAFSLGLAFVLSAVGLLFVKGCRIISGITQFAPALRFLSVASAFVILGFGVWLTFDAVTRIQL